MICELAGDFLQKLRGFFFVAQHGSFSKAAKQMNRNQSTISHQIKLLEEELGTLLFRRHATGVELTPQGEKLMQLVVPLFSKVIEIQEELKNLQGEYTGKVVIFSNPMALQGILLPLLPELTKEFPKITFDITQNMQGFPAVLDSLYLGESDICIAIIRTLPKDFEAVPICDVSFYLVAHQDYMLPSDQSLQALAALPHISLGKYGTIAKKVNSFFAEQNLHLNVAHTVSSWELQVEMVRRRLGVAIICCPNTAKSKFQELQYISLDNYFEPRRMGLILRKKGFISPQAQAVIDFILKNKNTVLL